MSNSGGALTDCVTDGPGDEVECDSERLFRLTGDVSGKC